MQICGEHKESGILRHGFLASPLLPDSGLTEIDSGIRAKHKGGYLIGWIFLIFLGWFVNVL